MKTLLAIAALCACVGANAEPRAFYVGEPASEAGAARAEEILRANASHPPDGGLPVHLSSLLRPSGVTVVGAEYTFGCHLQRMDRAQYLRLLDETHHALNEVQLDEAWILLLDAAAAGPCLDGWIAPEELAAANFLAGIHAFYLGNLEDTREEFRMALARAPDLPWNSDYPPTAQQEFAAALLEIGRAQPATVVLHVLDGTEIWLDGRPLRADVPSHEIAAGAHLVQARAPDGHRSARGFKVDEGAVAHVVDRISLDTLDVTGEMPPVVVSVLADAQSAAPDEPVVLAALGSAPRAFVLDDAGRSLVDLQPRLPAPPPPAAVDVAASAVQPVRPSGPAPGPIVLATVAGAVMAAGAVFAIGGASEALEFKAMMEDPATRDEEWDPLFNTFTQRRTMAYAGYAMMAAGGTCLGIAIPVGIASERSRTVRASVTVVPPFRGGAAGFGVSVTIE